MLNVNFIISMDCILLILAGILHYFNLCNIEFVVLILIMLTLIYRLIYLNHTKSGKK